MLGELDQQQRLDWKECFADGSFASAKKGDFASEKQNAEKVQSGWWWSMSREFLFDSASPAEVQLIETTLQNVKVLRQGSGRPREKIPSLIYDRACDLDPLPERLTKRGIELIFPHRKNRAKPKTQDGRKLRRYRRCWKVERTFA